MMEIGPDPHCSRGEPTLESVILGYLHPRISSTWIFGDTVTARDGHDPPSLNTRGLVARYGDAAGQPRVVERCRRI